MQSIVVQDISKSFAADETLKNVSFEVRAGELFGLIGPDGAGKTTLLRILATLLLPSSGSATVAGLDVVKDFRQLRQIIGYMPGRFSLYQDLSVAENLEFFAAVFGTTVRENYDLIAPIYSQIEPFKNRRAGALSGGMKQKLALSCALIHRPEILLLDEPGTGVDPVSRKEFWDMLRLLHGQGMTILVSTPNMDEAALCDRVALLQKGEILAVDTPEGVRRSYQKPLFAVRSDDMYRLIQDLRTMPGAADCFGFGEYAHLSLRADAQFSNANVIQSSLKVAEIVLFLIDKGHENVEVRPITADIEDCFIELMVDSGR
ncbi:MAG: ABC transporter ATP-binding protein [Saprospiraceae bacterium]